MSAPIEFKLKSCSVADFDSHKVMLEITTMGRTHRLVCDAYELWQGLLGTMHKFVSAQQQGQMKVDSDFVLGITTALIGDTPWTTKH